MGTPMRVCMVTTSFPRYEGDHAGHFIAALAERLVALGHRVTVLAPHEGSLPTQERVRGVEVVRFRYLPGWAEQVAYGSGVVVNLRRRPLAALGLLPFSVALRRALHSAASGHDLVHVHWGPTAALAAPWRLPTPYVLTLHGSDVTLARRGGFWLALQRRALKGAAGVDVVAEEQSRFLVEEGLWDDHRPLSVIPAGVQEELLERPSAPRAGRRFTFLFVGRLVESKGVHDLLAAFDILRSDGVDADLEFVGAGHLEQTIDAAADGPGSHERVRHRGALSHDAALDAIARAGALVLPSYGEGSPLVVAEALALGTPVIGTRVGAIPDLLGPDGLLFEPGDVDALAATMRRIATDDTLRQRLSAEGRVRASQRLAWTAIAESTVALYAAALGDQR
jgi:glycosyltransferase involved in cell wall biosynthesis